MPDDQYTPITALVVAVTAIERAFGLTDDRVVEEPVLAITGKQKIGRDPEREDGCAKQNAQKPIRGTEIDDGPRDEQQNGADDGDTHDLIGEIRKPTDLLAVNRCNDIPEIACCIIHTANSSAVSQRSWRGAHDDYAFNA